MFLIEKVLREDGRILMFTEILMFMKIMLAVLSVIFFTMGTLMLRKKPVFIKGYQMTLLLGICYLPALSPVSVLRGDFNFIGLLFLALFVFLIFVLKKSFGDYTIYNAEENQLYESIFTALEEQGVEYKEARGKIILPSLNSEIKINVNSTFKVANIHIGLKKNKDLSQNLVNRVKNILAKEKIEKVSLSGVVYIFGSLFLIALFIWLITF